jgi:hypothetical protein
MARSTKQMRHRITGQIIGCTPAGEKCPDWIVEDRPLEAVAAPVKRYRKKREVNKTPAELLDQLTGNADAA